jgi:hypothetical protein
MIDKKVWVIAVALIALHLALSVLLVAEETWLAASLIFIALYFLLFPLAGIYLCHHFISKKDSVFKSTTNVTVFFFCVLLASWILDSIIHPIWLPAEVSTQQRLFNVANSIITFAIVAFIGSLICSFVISKINKK